MKIITWNVNWIRAAAKKWFKEFVLKENPDILCIQETKAFEAQFLKEVWNIEWYNYIWHSWISAWYAWTAIFYKNSLAISNWKNHFEEVEDFHTDWRITEVKVNDFILINCYFPNWGTRSDWTEMLTYKLEFYDKIIDYANKLVASWISVVITWDFNICHTEIDIARPKENENSIWFLPIERAKFSKLLDNWYTDVWRKMYPDKRDVYSWWSVRAWARPRNIWWRLDYFVVNNNFLDKIVDVEYMTQIMWSDHCPVKLELKS